MKFKDIKKSFGQFIPDVVKAEFEFLREYHTSMDYRYINKYGDVSIPDFTSDSYTETITGIMLINDYRFSRLYETTKQMYDMVSNYDKTSTITTEYGATTNTKQYGATTNTKQYGSIGVTKNFGEQNVSLGESNGTTTESVSAYNSDVLSPSTSSTSHTDSINNVTGARVDTVNTAERTDTDSNTEHTDTDSNAKHTDTVTETTKGNIGTVSAMDLIDKERQIDNFSFYDEVFKIIVNSICTGVWEL